MTIREQLEQREKEYLSPYAALSIHSKGREREEEQCDIRPVFQRDRDRILHCKSFRRLKDKTQVFLTPDGDHYRTMLTHTLEVSQNARTITKALRLNEDLVEAIALGHDLGHTPFGHAGERALNRICPYGFEHNVQSVRTVDKLEKNGQGLNLTAEVRDRILNHQTAGTGERLDHFIHDIVTNSADCNDIKMSEPVAEAMQKLRQFMFERVYMNREAKSEEGKAEQLMETLYEHYLRHIDELPPELLRMLDAGEPKEKVVCDHVGAMTDRFAIATYEELYIPKSWHG